MAPEKAVLACSSAVREWDCNGTNFGYNPERNATAGEFGHNDFYPVAIAAAQLAGLDGRQALVAMAVLDEIRGRLAEVFALKNHKIDHVVHGAIASAAVYGAMLGASVDQIESAIGLVLAHYIPFRAIRHGHQLSDSKGASAAISTEVAVLSMRRAMRGFVGPADILRNPQAIFCLFEPPARGRRQPVRSGAGDRRRRLRRDGHALQAGALRAPVGRRDSRRSSDLIAAEPKLLDDPDQLLDMRILIYEPAFSIIGDPHKRDPQNAAKCRPLDGLHRRDAVAQGVRSPSSRLGWPGRLAAADACAGRLRGRRLGIVPSAHAPPDAADRFPPRRRRFRSPLSRRDSNVRRDLAREAGTADEWASDVSARARTGRCSGPCRSLLAHKCRLLVGSGCG